MWRIARDFGLDAKALARANRLSDSSQVRTGQVLFIPSPLESNRFLWPLRGSLTPVRGSSGYPDSRSLEISAPEGSLVRASRTGRVAVATRDLKGWGRTVILDHEDGYLTVYAGLEQLLVGPGASVQQGNPVGKVGRRPLYFEIRYGTHLRDPRQLLP